MTSTQTKTACITGSNRGIGFELTKQLTEKGYHVYAICRQSSDQLESLSNTTIIDSVDVTSLDAIRAATQKIDTDQLDILINNAGLLRRTQIDGIDADTTQIIKDQFEINALGPVLVTSALLPKLNQHSKVALITSRMGSIEDNTSGSHYGYRMSKAALNAAGKSMALDLKTKGVPVAILHPGWIQTEMTGHTGNDTPDTAAGQLLERIDQLNLDNSGTFWHANGDVLPW